MDSSLELDDIGERFEQLWSIELSDPIRQFLSEESLSATPNLLGLLLEIDIERRRQSGGTICESDYVARFPESEEVVATAFANCLRRVREAELEATVLETPPSGASRDGESDLSRPEQVGHFLLGKELGKGGMGTVFEATQIEPFRRQVALKLIRLGTDSRTDVARFQSERQALALMDHPNIARVFEAGVSHGQPFLAMELVQGSPITTYCDQHRLSIQDRLELFVQTCRAVQHAHTKGVIHRDIKPPNVLVTEVEDKPVVKVIDFGLARAFGEDVRLVDETITADVGAIAGTLAYMSPEQTRPQSVDIDTRSDVYSLGALLYEVLTGTTPISRAEVKSMALSDVLKAICDRDAIVPSQKAFQSDDLETVASSRNSSSGRLSSLLRGDLDWITIRALEKDRDRRYQSPEEFTADILRHLNNEPVVAGPPSAVYRMGKFFRRHPAATVAGALTVISTLIFSVTIARVRWLEQQREGAELRADLQSSRADLAVQKQLVTQLTSSLRLSTSDTLESRLDQIDTALSNKDLPEEYTADLLIHRYDLLRSVQLYDQAARTIECVDPQTRAQTAKLLFRKLVMNDDPATRSSIRTDLSEYADELTDADNQFLEAMLIQEPMKRIPVLLAALEDDPQHLNCRHQLLLALILVGDTGRLYEVADETALLFPDNANVAIYRAFGAAFAGDTNVRDAALQELEGVLTDSDLGFLRSVMNTSGRLLEVVVDMENGGVATGPTVLSLLTEIFGHAESIQSTSPVLQSLGREASLGIAANDSSILLTTQSLLARFTIITTQLAFGSYSGFVALMEDLRKASPIPNDAYFSFVQGLIKAGEESAVASAEGMEQAVNSPSILPVVRSEACYLLTLALRGKYLASEKDPVHLEKAITTLYTWLERNPRLNGPRLRVAVDTALAADDHQLAREFLKLAVKQVPNAESEFLFCRLRLLLDERAFVSALELSESVLADPKWEDVDRLQKQAQLTRDKARTEISQLASLIKDSSEIEE